MSIERNSIANMAILDETPLIIRLPRSEIVPDPGQPRKKRDPDILQGIADTMQVRQLQPILVTETTSGYQIAIGEGRWLAAGINEKSLGIPQYLDCIIVDETNIGKIRIMQIVENLQREGMSQIDTANSFQELIDLGECKNASEVAKRVGMSNATVSVYLSVLNNAPEEVKALIQAGASKMDAAKDIIDLNKINPEKAKEVIGNAIKKGKLEREVTREALSSARGKSSKLEQTEPAQSSIATPLLKPSVAPGDPIIIDQAASKTIVGKAQAKTEPVLANKTCVYVALKESSKDFWTFGARINTEGSARLANNLVHSNAEMVWVNFGEKSDNLGEFKCADLIIQSVVAV